MRRPRTAPTGRGTPMRCSIPAKAESGRAMMTTISTARTRLISWRKTSPATTSPNASNTIRYSTPGVMREPLIAGSIPVVRPLHAYRAVALAAALALAALLVHALLVLLLTAVVGVILSLPLSAAADRAQRAGLPRAAGALAALAAAAGIVTGLGFVIVPAFVTQARQFGQQLPSILTGVQHQLGRLGVHHVANLNHQLTSYIQG